MAVNLPIFPSFDLAPRDSVATRFDKYIKRLENMFVAMKIDDNEQKKAMLQHYVGEESCDIIDTLTITDPPPEDSNVYLEVVKSMRNHFEPEKCTDHHVYLFRKETQRPDENTAEFYTRLQLMSKKCEFTDNNLEIKRQIIQGTNSSRLRRKAMESELTLANLLKAARAMESTDDRTNEMENSHNSHQANKLHVSKNRRSYEQQSSKPPPRRPKFNQRPRQCGLCGGIYPHESKCPASGKNCRLCGKQNHFAKMCRSKPHNENQPKLPRHRARMLETNTNTTPKATSSITCERSDEEYTFRVDSRRISDKPLFNVMIGDSKINIMADSGASVNILNENDYQNMKDKPKLLPSRSKVYPYMSNKPLDLCGKFQTNVSSGHVTSSETFYVVRGPSSSLLSWQTSPKLNLIKIAEMVSETNNDHEILTEFPSVTEGMGTCKCPPVKVHVDPSIKPVAQPHRRILFHVRKQVETKLNELEKADIIEKVEGPTPWISPIVVVPKPSSPDEIRICVDMRSVNRAIIRERHIIPTTDDIVADLNGCKVFSKIDLRQGYHQILLHPESRNLTTFSTHIGLYRYKRLNFGMSCSAEIFQKIVSDIISGIPGVKNISDDIYVGGRDINEHDNRLRTVLRRLQENNLRINLPKCQIRVPEMLFFGHVFSGNGISPDPKKVAEIHDLKPPNNVTEVRSLLSSASFCSRYIPDFASITRPMRILTHKNEPWRWESEQQNAFENLKSAISAKTTLSYFDPEKPTVVYVDGSPIGLGAVLAQTDPNDNATTPLYYASYPLSATEARYPQIDREALSIYWAIKRFHLYLYGKEFKIISDHQPLVSLFNNPASKPSARIERWLMELQRYRFTVEYQPGKTNPADYASRHPSINNNGDETNTDVEAYVSYVVKNAVPKAMSLSEIKSATENDLLMKAVISCLQTGKWYKPPPGVSLTELSRYENVKSELTYDSDHNILLKSNRIVIPTVLQERTVSIAHEGHLGMVKTKALMREKVWFPMMDKMVEQTIKSCLACQIATPVTNREPLKMTELPSKAFELVSVDFANIDGETVLVVVDDYSRFPFVEPVNSTAASAVIPKLDQIFSTFGTPDTLKSDNGPPFTSSEFARFSQTLGFKHRKVTPLWPRANGEVERFVRTLKKHVKVAKVQGQNWRRDLQTFLRNYRASPHCTTNVSPSTLFLKREVKIKLPQIIDRDPASDVVRVQDEKQKSKMKDYADRKVYVKPNELSVGDHVIVKTPYNMVKSGLPYERTPLVVTAKKGTMVTASSSERTVTRNSSFFKPVSIDQQIDEHQSEPNNPDVPDDDQPIQSAAPPAREVKPPAHPSLPVRRSDRTRKAPERLIESF